jgi:CheY-like chemotaxis protein
MSTFATAGDPERSIAAHQTVLVVEDDPSVRAFAIRCIQASGYRVIAAESGDEAFDLINEHVSIDLLFTDIMMPGKLCGWGLAREARRVLPDLPVVFASGYTAEALTAGAQFPERSIFLAKPYRLAALRSSIEAAMKASAPRRH